MQRHADHPAGEQRADNRIAAVSPRSWQQISAGAGAHGPREYHWARIAVRAGQKRGGGHWLLARRSLSDPAEIAYEADLVKDIAEAANCIAVVSSLHVTQRLAEEAHRFC